MKLTSVAVGDSLYTPLKKLAISTRISSERRAPSSIKLAGLAENVKPHCPHSYSSFSEPRAVSSSFHKHEKTDSFK